MIEAVTDCFSLARDKSTHGCGKHGLMTHIKE
jgi:hypothetical protein